MKRATLADIQNASFEDLNKMSTKELRNLVSNAADVANKRVRNLRESKTGGKLSPALAGFEKAGGKKFSTRGKDRNELLGEAVRVKKFLGHKTSTVAGVRQLRKETEKRIGRKFKNEEDEKKFWEGYRAYESRAKDKGYFYESSGAISAYGQTTEADIEKKMEDYHPRYKDMEGNVFVDKTVYQDEDGNVLTYEQAYELAEIEVIKDRAEKYLIASPENQALKSYGFNGPSLGGN